MANIYERNVLDENTPEINGESLRDTGAIRKLQQQAAQFEKTGVGLYAQQLRTDSAIQMNEAYTKYANDPDMLEKEFADIRNGFLSTITRPDVAADFLTNYDLKSSSLLASARVKRDNFQRAETKTTMNDALTSNLEDLTEAAIGIFSADDDDTKIGFAHARQQALNAINSKGNNGLNVFSDTERKAGNRGISKGVLVGLQTFLEDPSGDENRKAEIINRFNTGEYKEMFSAEDYPKALRLIKTASKQYGGGSSSKKDDDETVAGEMLKIHLDEFKEDNQDPWYSKAGLIEMLDFRESASAMYEQGQITSKEYNEIMKESAPALAKKIDDYAGKSSFWGTKPMQLGYRQIKEKIADMNLSDDQKLFLYEDFSRRYRADRNIPQGEDPRSDENRQAAKDIADEVVQKYIEDLHPSWDPKVAPAIVMGRTIYRAPTSSSELLSHKDYKIMEF